MEAARRAASQKVFKYEEVNPDAPPAQLSDIPTSSRLAFILGRKATAKDVRNINLHPQPHHTDEELVSVQPIHRCGMS